MGAAPSQNGLLCAVGLPGGNNDAPPPTEKPSYVEVQAGKWGAPWKLALSKDELERLPHELHAATLSIRGRIGRRNVAYPMPVGAHSVTESKKFKPRPDDVIILTFHKTGTTWMQQICHQLRTEGRGTNFKEITEVMPWIDFAWEIDQDLTANQVAAPRLFKSHARLSAIQEGCKYLVTIRDPVRTLVSLFRFFKAKFPNPPFPAAWLESVDNFAKCPLWAIDSIWGGNYWEYMAEFWACRHEPNVHLVAFEDLKEDLKAEIPAIAAFLGLRKRQANTSTVAVAAAAVGGDSPLARALADAANSTDAPLEPMDSDLLAKVVELSSLSWMSEHDEQFSEGWFFEEQLRLKRYDNPPLPPVAKVNGTTLAVTPSDETVAWMQAMWTKLVAPRTGCLDYAEMLERHREEVADELAQRVTAAATS